MNPISYNIPQELHSAVRYYKAGNFLQAENNCRNILSIAPNNAIANNLLGIISCQKGDVDLGITFIQKAVENKPDFAEAYNNLGYDLFLQKK